MLRRVDDGLWVAESDFRMTGLSLGGRMTVTALADGGLAVFSPLAPNETIYKALEALGEVRFVIAPNLFHHLHTGPWLKRFPKAKLLAPPGLTKKRKDLDVAATLSDEPLEELAQTFDYFLFQGMPRFNEFVFFHRRTGTLIATDLVLNIRRSDSLSTRLYLKLNRAYGRVGQTILHRLLTADRTAAQASRARLLAWDLKRVIIAHGEIIESSQLDEFRQALARFG